jgi:signal transduction histidine kinase
MQEKSKMIGKQWIQFWHWLSLGMVTIAWLVTIADPKVETSQKILATALSLIWVAWYLLIVARAHDRNNGGVAVTFIFAYLISGALGTIHPIFLMLLFTFYGITFGSLVSRFAVPLIVLLSVLIVVMLTYTMTGTFQIEPSLAGSFLLTTAFAIIIGLYIESIYKSAHSKQEMIERLQAAQADLAQAERQAGMWEERQRLAGEIHDTLAQGFTSIVMQLEAAEATLEDKPETAREHLTQARNTARESLGAARRFLWALRPDVLESEPLAKSLERLIRRFSEESDLNTHLEISGENRIAQEGLINVRKHAHAQSVTLTLSYFDNQVMLDIQDDGVGLTAHSETDSPADPLSIGYGLIALRERLTQLGGMLEIESTPDEGTTLVASIPLGKVTA